MALEKDFEFVSSERIVFGNGSIAKVKESAKAFGRKALLICGSGSVPMNKLVSLLREGDIVFEIFRVEGEPDISTIEAGLSKAKASESTFVIGYGGGSVLDTGKAISAMMTNPGALMDYLEVIGGGKKIVNSPAPMIAIPTTAGTGTEVTRNAVIASAVHHVKVSMRSPLMIPKLAIVDPELTISLPPSVTASGIYLWDEDENSFQISHLIGSKNMDNNDLIGEEYQPGDFPILDAVYQNNRPVVYPFVETILAVEDWDLALPDEGQQDPSPILQSRYPLLMGFPLSVKDQVFGVLIAQDNNFSSNRERRFDLLNGIAQQASLAIQNDILNKEMLDRQRIEREFQLAREIQQTFLPDQIPEMPGWEMAVHWETARQVGGDFYDYFLLPDGRMALVIADVSDKGLAASLYMTVTRTLLRAVALESNSPARTLERVNDLLLENSQNGLFITTFYGILSLTTGKLAYTIAGHNPPLILRSNSELVIALDKGGIALGALADIELENQQLTLNPGDCLVLYTDGVTEAFNFHDEMYGEERLIRILRSAIGKNARFSLETIEVDLDEFRGDAPLSDDTTILTICRSKLLTDQNRDLSSP